MSEAVEAALLERIEAEREAMLAFLQGFIRERSPNPPGDTQGAAAHVTRFLDERALPWRNVAPNERMPNIVGTWDAAGPGRHLVLNGHMDVFPADDPRWSVDPWSGTIRDGKVYGRGACDMKAGTTASIFTYALLYPLRDRLHGRLTLACVSDEETFGPWGARHLIEHEPEVLGDCMLNGEPSSPYTIRFGEKAPLWLLVTVRTTGAHGAYVHATKSATKSAFEIARRLESVCEMRFDPGADIRRAMDTAREAVDRAMGPGASEIAPRVTLNIGRIEGGLKVNMIPNLCRMEVDIRVPPGGDREAVLGRVREILAGFPEAEMEVMGGDAPSASAPDHEMVGILQTTVERLRGFRPAPVVSLGGTDARLWRQRGIPAYVYGPSPSGMASHDEYVEVDEFVHVVRTHVLAAFRYLSQPGA